MFAVAGSPIRNTGSIALTLANQSANLFFAGPTSGGAVAPTFRALVDADIPAAIARDAEVVALGTPLLATATISSLTFSAIPTQAECNALRDALVTLLGTLRVHG